MNLTVARLLITFQVFLTPFAPQRLLAPDRPRAPNPDCPICGNYQTSVCVDLSRATLNDLVEDFVKLQLGFGERDFAVNSDTGLLYDPDETDNLEKLLSELGKCFYTWAQGRPANMA